MEHCKKDIKTKKNSIKQKTEEKHGQNSGALRNVGNIISNTVAIPKNTAAKDEDKSNSPVDRITAIPAYALKIIHRNIAGKISKGFLALVFSLLLIITFIFLLSEETGIFFEADLDGYIEKSYSEINKTYSEKIEEIKNNISHDEEALTGSRATFRDVLTVFASIYRDDETTDDEKSQRIVEIFWEMTDISYSVNENEYTDENSEGNSTVLSINVKALSALEYSQTRDITQKQKESIELLTSDMFADSWRELLKEICGYGDMSEIAYNEIGNVGGEKYWSWYGYESRVEWCACFVSWCADQCGLIENNEMIKFASCIDGANFFKKQGRFEDGTYTPDKGDVIFFDWSGGKDGIPDHVGIVYEVKDGFIYTVEGNSSDMCKTGKYELMSGLIYGFGVFSL